MRLLRPFLQCPQKKFVAGLFFGALALRLIFAGFFHTRHPQFVFPDSQQYDLVAKNLLNGRGFILQSDRLAGRPPVYPLLMVLCGRNLLAIRVLQAFIGAASVFLVFGLSRTLFHSESAARLAAAAMAVEPFAVFFTGLALTETLFTAVLLAAGLALAAGIARIDLKLSAAAGCFIGLGTMVRPSLLLFPLLLLPVFLLASRPMSRALLHWFVLAGLFLLCLAPWTVRNYRLLHALVPTTTQGGESLWEANNPRADGGPMMDQPIWPPEVKQMPELERDRFLKDEAWKFIRANPGRFATLCASRLLRFWNLVPNFSGYRAWTYMAISIAATLPLYALAILGLAGTFRHHRPMALVCLAPIVYTAALHAIFVGSVRYRVPVIPFLICFAAVALAQWLEPRLAESSSPDAHS